MTVITLESITLEIVVDAVAGGTGGAVVRDDPKFAVDPYLSNSETVRFLVDELPVLPSLKNAMELASFSLKTFWLGNAPDIENQM